VHWQEVFNRDPAFARTLGIDLLFTYLLSVIMLPTFFYTFGGALVLLGGCFMAWGIKSVPRTALSDGAVCTALHDTVVTFGCRVARVAR
jgi:hypothetical protein